MGWGADFAANRSHFGGGTPYRTNFDQFWYNALNWSLSLYQNSSSLSTEKELSISVLENFVGINNCTINVTDGTFWDSQTFWINVTAVNDAPVLNISNQTTQDNLNLTINLTDYTSDIDNTVPDDMVWYVEDVGNETQLNCTVVENNLTIIPELDQGGLFNCTINVTDGDLWDSSIFWINVTESNNAPVLNITNQTTLEETEKIINLSDYTTDDDVVPDNMTWFVYDVGNEDEVNCSVVENNLTIVPATDFYGINNCSVNVTDGSLWDNSTFWIDVINVNDVPVLNISNQTTSEDTDLIINLTDYTTDVDNEVPEEMSWNVVDENISQVDCSLSDGYAEFDGASYLNLGNESAFDLEDNFTIMAWGRICDSCDEGNDLAFAIGKGCTVSACAEGYTFYAFNDQILFFGGGDRIVAQGSWDETEWHLYTVVMNESSVNLYRDNALTPGISDAWTGTTLNSSPTNLTLGFEEVAGDSYVNGSSDNIKIFNRVLSTQEIIDEYNAGIQNITSNVSEVDLLDKWEFSSSLKSFKNRNYHMFGTVNNILGSEGIGVAGFNLTMTPAENWYGIANCSINVTDGEDLNSQTFWINVTPVDDLGSINLLNVTNESAVIIDNVVVNYSTTDHNITFNVNVSDVEGVDSVWVEIWNGLGKIGTWFLNLFSGSIFEGFWSVDVEMNDSFVGELNYSVYANDSFGVDVGNITGNLSFNYYPVLNISNQTTSENTNLTISLTNNTFDVDSDVPDDMTWYVEDVGNETQVNCSIESSSSPPIFWNKMDSNDSLQNSEIGSDILFDGNPPISFNTSMTGFGNSTYMPWDKTGASNFIEIPSVTRPVNGAVGVWIRPDGWGCSVGTSDSFQHRVLISDDVSSFVLEFHANGARLSFRTGSNTVNTYWSCANNPLTANNWHYVSAAWSNDDDFQQFYIDGVALAHSTGNWIDVAESTVDWTIGIRDDQTNSGLQGDMDNLMIWDYAKTDFSDRFTEDSSSGGNNLNIVPAENFYGINNCTINVTDADNLWDSQNFWIDVTQSPVYNVEDCGTDYGGLYHDSPNGHCSQIINLTQDIVCSGTKQPLCNNTPYFIGNFTGNNNTITNLTVDCSADYCGLYSRGGNPLPNFKDIGFFNATVTASGQNHVGILIGSTVNRIDHSFVSGGSVSGNYRGGGFVGSNSSNITNSYYNGIVDMDNNYAGGLVGHDARDIKHSYTKGKFDASSQRAGGLVASSGISDVGITLIVNESFSIPQIITSAGKEGGILGDNVFGSHNFQDAYFNNATGGPPTCFNDGAAFTGTCTAIQDDEDYFKNLSNLPMSRWDVTNLWDTHRTVEQGLPYLMNFYDFAFSDFTIITQEEQDITNRNITEEIIGTPRDNVQFFVQSEYNETQANCSITESGLLNITLKQDYYGIINCTLNSTNGINWSVSLLTINVTPVDDVGVVNVLNVTNESDVIIDNQVVEYTTTDHNVSFNVNVSDVEGVDSVWVEIWNGFGKIGTWFLNLFSGSIFEGLWSVDIEMNDSFAGDLDYFVYANDTFGYALTNTSGNLTFNYYPVLNITNQTTPEETDLVIDPANYTTDVDNNVTTDLSWYVDNIGNESQVNCSNDVGKISGALVLNKTNKDYLTVPEGNIASSIDSADKFTIEAWFKWSGDTTGPGGSACILCQEYTGTGDSIAGFLALSQPDYYYWFGWHPDYFSPGLTSSTQPTIGVWEHVVGTYDGENTTLYVNGDVIASDTIIDDITKTANGYFIGRRWNTPGQDGSYLGGNLDEIRVYNRSLSSEEINNSRDRGLLHLKSNNSDEGLLGYWSFDTDFRDDSGNEGNGTATNNPTILNNKNITISPAANFSGMANCTVSTNDGYLSDTQLFWINVTNVNDLPTVPVLVSPTDQNYTLVDRSLTFVWNESLDIDSTNITYNLLIQREYCNDLEYCSVDLVNISGINTTNYTVPDLDVDALYNWTVRAFDEDDYTEYATTRNFSIIPYLSIVFTQDLVNFTTMGINEKDNTTDDDPQPFVIENQGNVYADIVNISSGFLFDRAQVASDYYMFKVDNFSEEEGAFNYSASLINWTQVTGTNQTAIERLNYNTTLNSAEIDILVEVPSDEPPGNKITTFVVYAAQT